ncbi:MAG: Smr/MutS family protein [Deltaproteobacteria bacterium]|jgi:DNA mismatch repair protein MutS2|nr:Smr/MutS family protein [Deltaproteobacteria bacterium]
MNERTLRALEYGKVLQRLSDCCVSESGKAAALRLRPLPSCHEAREAAALFEETRTWAALAAHHGYRFGGFPDIRLAEALAGSGTLLEAEILWAVREALREARRATSFIHAEGGTREQQAQAAAWPRLAALASFPLPEQTRQALERCLSDDARLRDESSPDLLLVRGQLRGHHQNCLRKVRDFARQYNMEHYLQDSFMGLASDRYVLPLKANFKGRMQGIIHHWSQTGESLYFEPLFLVDINNQIQELKQREREEERKVLARLTALVRAELPAVQAAFDFLARLDVLLAQCMLAGMLDASCPSLGEEGGVELLQARHPLLALNGEAQPVDVVLRPGERCLIISGGNAGGKTVCLKTLGLVSALALTGLPAPVAKGSHLPAWTDIHAFIGDEQSLDDKLSTFTAQIRHLAKAWERLDSHSLVLLDEFGAGTDPAQGAALAQAVLDEALALGASVVAATHFPALKLYALSHPSVRAASVLFDPVTKKPLFRLAYDQVGSSQAFDVAREHGLPESILQRASHYLLPGSEDSGQIVARLNELAVAREKEIQGLKQEQERQRKGREKLQERFERERRDLHEEVRAKAGELMRAWKEGRATHKQALKEMARLRASLARPAPEQEVPPAPDAAALTPGQRVRYRPFGRQADILEIDARKKRVRLDMNGVSLWAGLGDIEASARSDAAPPPRVYSPGGAGLSLRLDLRGKRADAALAELGAFLDKALLANIEGAEIVHGRGTGALRREVHNFLRAFPGIAAFAIAPEEHGGDGMTMVTFT